MSNLEFEIRHGLWLPQPPALIQGCCPIRRKCRRLRPANLCMSGQSSTGIFPPSQKFVVLGYTTITTVLKGLPVASKVAVNCEEQNAQLIDRSTQN